MDLDKTRGPNNTENVPSVTQSTVTLDRKDVTDDDYDPFEHRDVTHPTSTLGAFFHLLKSSLGSGLLAMPAAFKNSGLVPGCIGTVLVGFIATHCVHILVLALTYTRWKTEKLFGAGLKCEGDSEPGGPSAQSQQNPARLVGGHQACWVLLTFTTRVFFQHAVSTSREVCKEIQVPLLSYTDTCEEVFKLGPEKLKQYSKKVRHFVDAAMAGVCLGGTSVYVIFIAQSLKDIFDYSYPANKYEANVYCGILLLPLILITQIRHLKFLVPFSILANICLVLTFGITCYYTFTDLPPNNDIQMVASVGKWPLFISTAIFAMEGINVVMPVENEMAKPQHFLGCPSVLNVTMIFVATLYGIVGIFGYLKYGEAVQGSITFNLPEGEPLALTAKILVAIAVFFTYCLQMYAPMDIIWSRLKVRLSKNYYNISQITLRSLSVTISVILAVAVPDLELLIGLVGAIFFSTLGLLIPLVVETVHRWERGLGKYSFILWKNGLLLIFYIIVLISGCYAAISKIVDKYNK